MNKLTGIFSILIAISLISLFSCGSKKELDTTATTDTMTEEQVPSETPGGDDTEGDTDSTMSSLDDMERVYFDFNDATLRSDARETLKKDAEILLKNVNTNVVIEGHCDERGSVEYNLALGERRAQSIQRYLAKLGVSTSRMSTISFGEEKPLVSGFGEEAWSKNRRGEIITK